MAGVAAAQGRTAIVPQSPPETPLLPPSPVIIRRHISFDREKTCPMLVRVFVKPGSHHSREEFELRGKVPKGEIQIYTWKDATLRELSDLVMQVIPETRRRDAWMSCAVVFPNRDVCFVVRRVGKKFSYGIRKVDDDKTLAHFGFQIGDYLDVAIF